MQYYPQKAIGEVTLLEHQEFLSTVSQIAVALVGFTGIVAAFRYRTDLWSAEERTMFRTMLRAAVSALFLSLVPYLLSIYLTDSELMWRLSSGLIAIVMATNIYASAQHGLGLLRVSWLHTLLFPAGTVIMIANLVAFAGLLPADNIAVSSLVWQLLVATHNFISLILGKPVKEYADPE
ncbi:MAG: hypothetical protein R3F41_13900 [Gammaproteobacteria bacterium]|nr:hypothetical protein [Pseudomonadales bacterium]